MRSTALAIALALLFLPRLARAAGPLVGGETVYRLLSHGCIRVHAVHMEPFFEDVEPGTPGEIIYQTVKAAAAGDGHAYLEVHRDVYGKRVDPAAEARAQLESLGLSGVVDWGKVAEVVKRKSGRAEDVTR